MRAAEQNGDGTFNSCTPLGKDRLLGNGDGTFGEETSMTCYRGSTLVFADANGDGRPDVVAGGGNPAPGVLFKRHRRLPSAIPSPTPLRFCNDCDAEVDISKG
jgi:hypothetical protein